MGVKFVAAAWGLAEATFFFIVPDVWTSAIGIKNLKAGLMACVWALGGAMAGGLVMYLWGIHDLVGATNAIEWVPAISGAMINQVAEDMLADGALAVLVGPLSGTPYKIYAVQAHHAGVSVAAFLLITVPARLARFMAITIVTHAIGRILSVCMPCTAIMPGFVMTWTLFYVAYFWSMPW